MTTYDDYGMPVGAYSEPESLTHQALRVARAFVLYRVRPRWRQVMGGSWSWRRMSSVSRVLVLLWVVMMYWGERTVFKNSIAECKWENWERWSDDANPHRLLLIADPQLIDPHTYPGRPWPLDTITVKLTDNYLRRTYSRIQKVLYPDTEIFLGDLFDGGREWSTRTSKSPEERYRKYGTSFWLKEYARFGNIFFAHWRDGGDLPRPGQPGRKIISSLPGNHDLGFGRGIQDQVRKRFNAYFGDGNRVDIIGNHTLVSLDSVSLSAYGQENPDQVQALWKPAMEFLDGVKTQKQRLVQEELRVQRGLKRTSPFMHEEIKADHLAKAALPKLSDTVTEFPTILLSHVPLYRAGGTPCGPLREHWPPTRPPKGQTSPLEHDDRNAISVSGGYQYQNVLDPRITKDIAEKVGNIAYAFSGDDHDYCEVVHRAYASAGGGIREITVKSTSMAMGIRRPGVVLVSLWNPVDEHGNPLVKDRSAPSLQTHLCLLPDELGILIQYGVFVVISLAVLGLRAFLIASGRISSNTSANESQSLLPTIKPNASSAETEKADLASPHHSNSSHHNPSFSNSSSTSDRGALLSVRNQNSRARSTSPGSYALPTAAGSQYSYPSVQQAGYYGPDDVSGKNGVKVWGASGDKGGKKVRKKGVALFIREFRNSVLKVAAVVVGWYLWLVWTG
ncbi:hypothetical protein M011DRAFT_437083 [Sporormia fimetaria CBS 119925]|uniref:Uncharacterized protein n=1 Tax=Sporormia fimetaria CBS 119925 TaxID=1340428 RepID=A0A6A6VJ97_9PLEO|nr:hypothetical protein M011DRAFT_437083 [Sporormia fimetaria CBS 119925]